MNEIEKLKIADLLEKYPFVESKQDDYRPSGVYQADEGLPGYRGFKYG